MQFHIGSPLDAVVRFRNREAKRLPVGGGEAENLLHFPPLVFFCREPPLRSLERSLLLLGRSHVGPWSSQSAELSLHVVGVPREDLKVT